MEFRILGPLEIRDGNQVVEIRGDVQRALLAVLLLNANTVVATERLIDDLWGGSPPASGHTALQVRVSQLRKGLGQDGRSGPIVTRAPGYLVEVGHDELDLSRFERLVQDAWGALEQGDPATASDKLRTALRLWRGPALADFGYADFARAAITRLEELRLAALELRIEADLMLGRHAQFVGELQALVLEHPSREQLRAHLMLALFRSGRQSDALAAYQEARRAIEEFGIEPSPALQELEGAILRHDPRLEQSDPQPTPGGGRGSARRAILVLPRDIGRLRSLLDLATPLARAPGRELILASLVEARGDLVATANELHVHREELMAQGLDVRTASFTSDEPGADAVRLAVEQSVDLRLAPRSRDRALARAL